MPHHLGWPKVLKRFIEIAMTGFFLVALGGAIGAVLRYGVGLLAARASETPGLFATFLVNVVGSFCLGLLMAWLLARSQTQVTHHLFLFAAVGLLGAFTTFSAFSLETVHMINSGAHAKAASYAIANTLGSVLALLVAFHLLRRLVS